MLHHQQNERAGIASRLVPVFALLALAAVPIAEAKAQTGPAWETQRMIWRCGHSARDEGLTGGSYESFVQNCIDKNEGRRRPATAGRIGASAEGVWSYGVHPVLGLSAHVRSGSHAVGLACGFAGTDPLRTDPISYRITPNLMVNATKPSGAITFFDGPSIGGGGTMFEARPGGYLERKDDGCGLDVRAFQRSKAILFVNGKFEYLNTNALGLRQNGVLKEIVTARDFAKLVDVTRIPLAGATAAINQLMRACPAMKRSVEDACFH